MKRKKILITFALVASLSAASSIGVLANTTKEHKSTGEIDFSAQSGITDVIDPEAPYPEVIEPDGTTNMDGILTIDYVSNFQFGQGKVSSNTEYYYAALKDATFKEDGASTELPNFVQVTDNRGTGAGWVLTVKQSKPFTTSASSTHPNAVLANTKVTIKNAELGTKVTNTAFYPNVTTNSIVLDATAQEEEVMDAEDGKGYGTYTTRFGSTIKSGEPAETSTSFWSARSSVELEVPASSTPYAEKYEAEFTWTLKNTPK